MKAKLLAITLMFSSFQAFAQAPSMDRESFCRDREDKNFVKDLTLDSKNLMGLTNQGGIGGGGVCWWHSRFQRNALYLTMFKPNLPRPSTEEAKDLIKQIREANNVVIIPGYSNFNQFSFDFRNLIQRELNKWQKGDGVLRFAWMKGLAGEAVTESEKLKQLMDQIYEEVEVKNNIAYNKLQIPGIVAHAWLVVKMEKVSNGYNLEVLDSNFPSQTETYRYHEGDTSLTYQGYYKFSPYLEQTKEMDKVNKTIADFCSATF